MTQTRISLSEGTPVGSHPRDAYRYALITAGLMALSVVAILLFFGAPPNFYDATYWAGLVCLAALFSAWLIKQGRLDLGIGLLIGAIQVGILFSSVKTSGLAIALAAVGLTTTFSISQMMGSRKQALFANVASVAIAILLLMLDLFEPYERISNGNTTATWIVAIGVILFYAITILRQTWKNIIYSIRNRLTILVLVITIPLLVGITAYISFSAGSEIKSQALQALQDNNKSLATNVSTWLELHVRSVKEMAMLPDITSMDVVRQKTTLKIIAENHPNLFLVHTTDLNGINVARNDDAEPNDYHDRAWFQEAISGAPISYEVLISRTIGKPALNIGAPIYDESGEIVGVASIVSELSEISNEVLSSEEGKGITYIVDANNHVVSHPDPSYTDGELRDLSAYPPIAALNEGKTGQFTFTDENGVIWMAYVDRLDNGWGIVAQQTEVELLAPVRQFQTVSIILILVGSGMMFALAWFVIRRSLEPIGELTSTVSAVAAGDLSRIADVKTQDELGVLASRLNMMTSQLRDLIGGLEDRVADRTKDLATVAEVATATATILETNKLLQAVVDITKERFNLYHSHIYLLDEAGENLVLASGAGEPGRKMVAEKRSIPLNRERSLVARAARERKGVSVNDVTRSADFLSNPLLPNTRSELAVPMIVGGKVIGVFDIQSDVIGRFTDSDINIQTTLASQVATSIQNVRSFEQSKAQAELETLVNSIGQKIQHTTTVEDTLQTAIREIGLALGASRVSANIQSNRQLELNKESVE